MGFDDDIERVIAHRVSGQSVPAGRPRVARDALQRVVSLFGRGREPEEGAEQVLELLSLLGVDEDVRNELAGGLEETRKHGVDLAEALPIIQAYARGIARIVEAEASLVRGLLSQRAEPDRAEYLDGLLAALMPLGIRGFEVIHSALLDATLRDELAPAQLVEQASAPMFVALIDLCGSTKYLAGADERATQEVVDALFEAGQLSVLGRHVRVMKYVGDGIFLVGRDPLEIAAASFTALDEIDAKLELQSRAGIAFGPVLRRAGDYFGLPVNLAQLLTKVADPETVLATREAAVELPAGWHGRGRRVRIRGWEERLDVVALRRVE